MGLNENADSLILKLVGSNLSICIKMVIIINPAVKSGHTAKVETFASGRAEYDMVRW